MCCLYLTCKTIITGAATLTFLLILLNLINCTEAGPIRTKAGPTSAKPLNSLGKSIVVEAGGFTNTTKTSGVIHKRFYLLWFLLKIPLSTRKLPRKLL